MKYSCLEYISFHVNILVHLKNRDGVSLTCNNNVFVHFFRWILVSIYPLIHNARSSSTASRRLSRKGFAHFLFRLYFTAPTFTSYSHFCCFVDKNKGN